MKNKELAVRIFEAAIKSVDPANLIAGMVRLHNDSLYFPGLVLPLSDIAAIYVIGAGKATAYMASAVEKILGDMISGGHIVVKYGHSLALSHIGITEAGHPVPDHNGFEATRKILGITDRATEKDLVISLISGGGSALLADYPEGACEDDVSVLNELLVKCGANIGEINAVRKHLSRVKGGQLARSAYPATLVNIMLSDVPGDDPDVIASGPACPDRSTFGDATGVIRKYGLQEKLPASLADHLEKGRTGKIDETPKQGDPVFSKTHNIIAGNNMRALEGALMEAQDLGFNAVIADSSLFSDVEVAARHIVETAMHYRDDAGFSKPSCILFGGETTVKVSGAGKGGRNQHLAILCAELISGHSGITILAGGTDGTDGPTDAAGAVVDPFVFRDAFGRGIDPLRFKDSFDSYNFFSENGGLVKTGPTGTNVMDIIVVLLD